MTRWSLCKQKYQYGAALVTVANFSSRKFSTLQIDSMLEHREKERFLTDTFSLAIVGVVTAVRALKACFVWTAGHRMSFTAHSDDTYQSL